MNILAIAEISKGDVLFLEEFPALDIDWFDTSKNPQQRFSFGKTLSLLKRLMAKKYDLVFMGRIAEHNSHCWPAQIVSILWRAIKYPNSFAPHLVLSLLQGTRLVGIDNGDLPLIRKENHRVLKKSFLYFKRELPQNLANSFLFTDKNLNKRDNIERFIRSFDGHKKILPIPFIAYGIKNLGLFEKIHAEKKYDLFFSGSVNFSSSVRQQGLEQLEALKAQGVRVKIIRDTPLPRAAAQYTQSPP